MLRFVIGLWLLVIASLTCAGQPADLYSSSALVPDQSGQIRRQVVADALAEVFIRVSGTRGILENTAIRQALADAESYLLEFEYASTDETLMTVAGVEDTAVRLLMKFSIDLVEGLLKREKLPYWHTNRPDVLLWMAKADERGGQQFIDESGPAADAFTRVATERGVILVKPVLDLEDRLVLPVSRLWALDAAAIGEASARYQTDAVLAGRFSPLDEGRWQGNFTLFYQAQEKSFAVYGENTQTIAMDVFEQVANYFAAIFTSVIDDNGGLEKLALAVSNIDSFAAYVGLLSYLESLPMVQKVNLMTVEGDSVRITLHYQGEQAVIVRTLSLDKRLMADDTGIGADFFVAGDSATVPTGANILSNAQYSATPRQGTEVNPLRFLWRFK